MDMPKIFDSEYRFCQILWENEPITSMELVRLCDEQLGWSKSTTYTVIRRLGERGVLRNEKTVVTSIISKEDAEAAAIDEVLTSRFSGSVPAFIAAFTKHEQLSEREIAELHQMIDEIGKK